MSTLSLATVPQSLDNHEADFDTDLHFMAALSVADHNRVVAISHHVKATDLGSADATIFAAMLGLARTGNSPTLPLVHGKLAREALFSGHKGPQLKSRMLEITTTNASPLQLDGLALAIVEAKFRRTAQAMGEGIHDAAQTYAIHALMPYTRELGTQLAAIDKRRMALGGESQ